MLEKANLLAKIGADTAENERKFAENLRAELQADRVGLRLQGESLNAAPAAEENLRSAYQSTHGGREGQISSCLPAFSLGFERTTQKRPSTVKRQPKMPQHTTRTDVGQIWTSNKFEEGRKTIINKMLPTIENLSKNRDFSKR